jgi:hypothetical protein
MHDVLSCPNKYCNTVVVLTQRLAVFGKTTYLDGTCSFVTQATYHWIQDPHCRSRPSPFTTSSQRHRRSITFFRSFCPLLYRATTRLTRGGGSRVRAKTQHSIGAQPNQPFSVILHILLIIIRNLTASFTPSHLVHTSLYHTARTDISGVAVGRLVLHRTATKTRQRNGLLHL